jgi:phosphoserine phosphatase RsbU/P
VLKGLNDTFQMSTQNEKYFTIWYGVYNRVKRQLTYASAGHPPAILITPTPERVEVQHLRTPSLPIGMIPDVTFSSDRCLIPDNSTLYVFSDGVYELNPLEQYNKWGLDEFIALLPQLDAHLDPDRILQQVQQASGAHTLNDDVSLLKVQFT